MLFEQVALALLIPVVRGVKYAGDKQRHILTRVQHQMKRRFGVGASITARVTCCLLNTPMM